MVNAFFYLISLSVAYCYLFNSEERVFAKDFYLQECLHSNQTICVTIDLVESWVVRTGGADEIQGICSFI